MSLNEGYQSVLQAHKGANGKYFDAWTLTDTLDPVRAVLEAQACIYNGEQLGKVKRVEYYKYK